MTLLNKTFYSPNLNLNNHLVFPPLATYSANSDGTVTEKLIEHYRKISAGGYIGLVIIEHNYINESGKANNNQMSCASDDMIPGLSRLAETIRKNRSKAVIQINHAGSMTSSDIIGEQPVSASNIMAPMGKIIPRALGITELKKIIQDFASAALRVKKAGFDGVELHMAHSYLLNQFYSPLTNNRTDSYGSKLTGRTRLILETVKAVRSAVGNDFPLLLRLGASDYMPGGTTISDSIITAKKLEETGVDIIDISGGLCRYNVPSLAEIQGYFRELSLAIKEKVSIPVILTGGITDPCAAEKLLESGVADLIGVGRAIFKNPDWPRQAISGI